MMTTTTRTMTATLLLSLLALDGVGAAAFTPRPISKVVRHTRLPVWPAWQGLPLVVLSQLPGPFRGWADALEDKFGGRVCPMQFNAQEADPFILLVHHRHAFRPLDFLRPLFSALILPEGFPAHPHRGFETVTYVLPGRAGLTHRDSEGCKMRYGDGAVQWMTAGRGMLHEEMWDLSAGTEHELYQLWVNLPPEAKMCAPKVQLLEPSEGGEGMTSVEREGGTPVRRAKVATDTRAGADGGSVTVRTLADVDTAAGQGAETYSPMTIAHVELRGKGTSHTVRLPEGWTCFAYVRGGRVEVGGGKQASTYAAAASEAQRALPNTPALWTAVVPRRYETVHYPRVGGDCARLTNLDTSPADVMIFAGQPIGAPVVASGTMVMNSEAAVQKAVRDYQAGAFGTPWQPSLPDEDWAAGVRKDGIRRLIQ